MPTSSRTVELIRTVLTVAVAIAPVAYETCAHSVITGIPTPIYKLERTLAKAGTADEIIPDSNSPNALEISCRWWWYLGGSHC